MGPTRSPSRQPSKLRQARRSPTLMPCAARARSPRSLHCPNRSSNLHTHVCQAPKGRSATNGYPELMDDSLGAPSPKLRRRALLATVAAAPVALATRLFRGTASSPITMVRVLVHLAMLSTASGWVLPPKEEADAFSSHATMTTGGVGGARDRRRLVASSCDPGNCISCDDGCDGSCDFFGGCDDSCDEHCDGGCDGSCDTGCSACSTGETGAAEQVTCGPPAVARPPNTHLTPVHRASSSTSRVPAPQAPGSAAAMV